MNNIKAIIFDMDGVIVHSNPAHKEVIDAFLKKHDKQISEEELRTHVYGCTNAEWIPYVFGDIPEDQVLRLGNEKEQWFREVFQPVKEQVPGYLDFLKELKNKDLKLVVATSAPKENADFILSQLEIKDTFDAILSSGDVSNGKPHPEPYLKAAKAVDVNPKECIVFEDSLAGVQSGLAAGATMIGVATTHTHEELSDCTLVIDDFRGFELEQLKELA